MNNSIEKLIQQLCPDGVEFKKLGEVCEIKKGVQFNKADMLEDGLYPVINGGVLPSGYINIANESANSITISQGGASAGYVNFINTDFWLGAHCYIVKPKECVLNLYLFHFIKNNETYLKQCQYGAGIPALNKGTIEAIEIPVPPLPIQERIVEILKNFSALTAELQAELGARKIQYEYYRNHLLSFDGHNNLHHGSSSSNLSTVADPDVKWVKLGEIAEIGTGSSNTNEELSEGLYPFYVRSQIVRWKNNYEFDDISIITSGDGVGVGKIFHITNGKYALHQRAYRIHITVNNISSKYIYHYMRTHFLRYIEKEAYSSSVTSIRRPMLLNFPIPLPPLSEQERIVSILDRFEALTTDLQSGLPAEIEARQKQYEYYRNKLLTFKRKE